MLQVPEAEDPNVLADWAEASCIFDDQASVSWSTVESILNNHVRDSEGAISSIWQEINRRHKLATGAHPVEALRGRLVRIQRWVDNPAYAFQLFLTLQKQYKSTKIPASSWGLPAKLFEQLTKSALEQYLGMAINIGTPRKEDVPKKFGECLDHVCEKLGEVKRTVIMYAEKTKDDGVDVVTWRSFMDGRPSQVVVLANCAAGGNWQDKLGEIRLSVWREHINWAADPIKAFAVPFVVDDTQWLILSKDVEGILLDRLRIATLFMAGGNSFRTLQTQLVKWCGKKLPHLPWLED